MRVGEVGCEAFVCLLNPTLRASVVHTFSLPHNYRVSVKHGKPCAVVSALEGGYGCWREGDGGAGRYDRTSLTNSALAFLRGLRGLCAPEFP
jgi:hypothetical protein